RSDAGAVVRDGDAVARGLALTRVRLAVDAADGGVDRDAGADATLARGSAAGTSASATGAPAVGAGITAAGLPCSASGARGSRGAGAALAGRAAVRVQWPRGAAAEGRERDHEGEKQRAAGRSREDHARPSLQRSYHDEGRDGGVTTGRRPGIQAPP